MWFLSLQLHKICSQQSLVIVRPPSTTTYLSIPNVYTGKVSLHQKRLRPFAAGTNDLVVQHGLSERRRADA